MSGSTFDIPFLPHNLLRPIQSTSPSGVFLFPQPALWQDEVTSLRPLYCPKSALLPALLPEGSMQGCAVVVLGHCRGL